MSLRVMAYRKGEVKEIALETFREYEGYNRWISVSKPDRASLEQIFSMFSLHPLVREDILNPDDPPKVDEYPDYTFMITDIPEVEGGRVVIHKLYIVLGRGYLISITDDWDIIRKVESALTAANDSISGKEADFLAYTLLDYATDRFYPVLDDMEDVISEVEEIAAESTDKTVLTRIADVRKGLLTLRKSAWRIRDLIMDLDRGESPYISGATIVYVRDIYDHVTQIMDLIETYRDILTSSRDIYMSSMSLTLNQIMKQLTIISTIMLPLTFIVGVYGMNFEFMPELGSPYGYPAVWAVIILIVLGMLAYFRWRKWI
jgi:magnesium transporter